MKIKDKFVSKKVTLDEIEKIYKITDYKDLYLLIEKLIYNNEIEPIKSSGGNGKKPTLYKRYRIVYEEEDLSEYINELDYKLISRLNISYYKKNIKKYIEHRKYILMLNNFLKENEEMLKIPLSMNERSFQIWGREKFLQKEEGKLILRNLGIDLKYLNYYDTSEPLAYYSRCEKSPQNILIVENKDTYYTIRKYLINSNSTTLGIDIDTVVYGQGKGIIKAFNDYEISVEDYMSNKDNTIYYFGDLDYEGILIYEGLFTRYSDKYNIKLFINGYIKMLEKAEESHIELPLTKEGQNRNIDKYFIQSFNEGYRNKIIKILEENLYIPQEIINITDL